MNRRKESDYIGKPFPKCDDLIVNRISQCGMSFFIHMFTVGYTWRSEISSIQESGMILKCSFAVLEMCIRDRPCGVCRQVMMEFCDPEEFQIILATSEEQYEIFTLKELFPLGFGPKNLKK